MNTTSLAESLASHSERRIANDSPMLDWFKSNDYYFDAVPANSRQTVSFQAAKGNKDTPKTRMLTEQEKIQLGASLRRLIDKGLPESIVGSVEFNVFDYESEMFGWFRPDTRTVTFNPEFLALEHRYPKSAVVKGALDFILCHELGHSIDLLTVDENGLLSSSRAFETRPPEIIIDENGLMDIDIYDCGLNPVIKEIQAVARNNASHQAIFDYAYGSGFNLDMGIFKKELFAQVFAISLTQPDFAKQTLPITHECVAGLCQNIEKFGLEAEVVQKGFVSEPETNEPKTSHNKRIKTGM